MTGLTDTYADAYADFYGSGTPCIFKTGPSWPKREGIEEQKLLRAARPIHYHRIRPDWLTIAWSIVARLDSLQVDWNSINPLAYSNAGEAALICEFVITIGVRPSTLTYEAAVTAAKAVDEILRAAEYPEIQVALIESLYSRRGAGPKLMNLDPLVDSIAALRKPFTHALGLSIAPLKSPYFEGTGGTYFRLSGDDDRVALFTCAHVSRPPSLFENTTMTRNTPYQPREDIVHLGTGAFDAAVTAIMRFIDGQTESVAIWEDQVERLGKPEEGESSIVTNRRKQLADLIDVTKYEIEEADKLHTEVTKYRTTAAQRVFGHVLHCDKIEVGVGSHKFTNDWSLIELDGDMVDWKNFLGNKIYVGGNKGIIDWKELMFSQAEDLQKYNEPKDDLLQIQGVVPETEFHAPQDLDNRKTKTLLAVKNGRSTGTTFGRVNGLESITRYNTGNGVHQVSEEYLVLGYDTSSLDNAKFSDFGDSGSMVVGRDGRAIGVITGGEGPADRSDKTYITPWFWLEPRIQDKFPGSFLYPVIE